MKKNPTLILQIVIVLIGMGALTFLLWEPHIEGRNVGATLFEIYFKDPFLVYAYTASISFFVALYQGFKLLRYVREDKVFSETAVRALQIIKYCAHIIVGFVLGGEVYLFVFQRGKDDIAGGVFMGLLAIFGAGIVAIVAKMFEGILQKGIETKSRNNPTN